MWPSHKFPVASAVDVSLSYEACSLDALCFLSITWQDLLDMCHHLNQWLTVLCCRNQCLSHKCEGITHLHRCVPHCQGHSQQQQGAHILSRNCHQAQPRPRKCHQRVWKGAGLISPLLSSSRTPVQPCNTKYCKISAKACLTN